MNASTVVPYAVAYQEADGYNEQLDEADGRVRDFRYSCDGALTAETARGYVVTTRCTMAIEIESADGPGVSAAEAVPGPFCHLVDDEDVIRAAIDVENRDFERPPYADGGILVANFADTTRTVGVRLEGDVNTDDAVPFERDYDVSPTAGTATLDVFEETGEYEVVVSVDGDVRTRHDWQFAGESWPEEPLDHWTIGEHG